jgi:signal transduction histidine kinase
MRHVDVMVTLFGDDGGVLFQNPAADEAFGPGEDAPGALAARFVEPNEAAEAIRALEECDRYHGDTRTHLVLGCAWHAVELRSVLDPASGRPAILETREDISNRRWTAQALEKAKDRAEAADRAKSAFLARMSHELRTPLNAIIGYSELLQDEFADNDFMPWYSEDLDRIHGAGKHLLGLINNVLDLSKIEAGQIELFMEPCDLGRLSVDVATTLRPLVEAGRNEFVVDVAKGLPDFEADNTRLRQILMNLLGNAAKFTNGGIIRLAVTYEDELVQLSISDTGIGLTAEQMGRIFQPFVQSDASVTANFGGTGLGLTITRRFCELMNGTIAVESEFGVGATFTVSLPLRVLPAPIHG